MNRGCTRIGDDLVSNLGEESRAVHLLLRHGRFLAFGGMDTETGLSTINFYKVDQNLTMWVGAKDRSPFEFVGNIL